MEGSLPTLIEFVHTDEMRHDLAEGELFSDDDVRYLLRMIDQRDRVIAELESVIADTGS